MTLFGRLAWDLRAAVRARLIYLARPSLAMAPRRLDLVDPRIGRPIGSRRVVQRSWGRVEYVVLGMASRRRIREEDHELETATGELKPALNDKKTLLERREQLRRRDRRAREDIDARLDHNREQQQHYAEEIEQLLAARKTADLTDHAWLAAHGSDAVGFLTRRELRARDSTHHRAAHRIQSLDRNPLERTLELPAHDLDTFDFGL